MQCTGLGTPLPGDTEVPAALPPIHSFYTRVQVHTPAASVPTAVSVTCLSVPTAVSVTCLSVPTAVSVTCLS